MKKSYVSSLSLPKGLPVSQYENLKEIVAAVKGDEGQVVNLVNLYLRQKGPLVEGRDLLATHVADVLKFPPVMEKFTKTVEGKEITGERWKDTEGVYLDKFAAAVVKGDFTVAGLALTGTAEQKDAAVWTFLQTIADKFELAVDAAKAERTSKPKSYEKLPLYARTGAEKIIAGGTQAKWIAVFTKEQVPFEPFDAKDQPESNKLNLATAIKEREDRKAKPDYA